MSFLAEQIALAREEEIEELLRALIRRYGELFPDWEISMISLQKQESRKAQLDLMIETLEKLKNTK